jgi:hypothetical protein
VVAADVVVVDVAVDVAVLQEVAVVDVVVDVAAEEEDVAADAVVVVAAVAEDAKRIFLFKHFSQVIYFSFPHSSSYTKYIFIPTA